MRFSFDPGKAKDLSSFFSLDSDYIDIYMTGEQVFLICDTAEVYSHKRFRVLSKEGFEESVSFRINKKTFFSLLPNGPVSIYLNKDGIVDITFKSPSGNTYSMTQKYQSSDKTRISAKLEILNHSKKFKALNLMSIEPIMRLVRGLTGIISVNDGVVIAKNNEISLFYKTKEESLSFSLYTSVINYIIRYGERTYGFQNYIVSTGEDSVIIARQVRSQRESEIDYILKRKYSHAMKVNISSLSELAHRCKDGEYVILDFNKESAEILGGTSKFKTKFKVNKVSSFGESTEVSLESFDFGSEEVVTIGSSNNIPRLIFSLDLIKNILGPMSRKDLVIKVKKTFIQFEVDNTYVVVGRKEDVA